MTNLIFNIVNIDSISYTHLDVYKRQPEEGRWVKAYEIKDISGLSHGIGWCAPQQGTCKLTLNVKEGVIEEALVETCLLYTSRCV